jgi:lipoate-protein ligase A
MLHTFYYRFSDSTDPYHNLAVEEYIVNHIGKGACMLYLYKNAHTVVIGKHQNPWRECKTDLLEAEEGRLVRRISGGGAVYHDLGNLNFSFIVDKEEYDVKKQLSVIVSAVNKLGIHAEPTGRNDITIDGRKFSGNAFCFKKQGAFHHGTILISTEMPLLSRYLQVSPEKIRSKGIESVQSRVVNLNEYNPEVDPDSVAAAVKEAFEEIYGKTVEYNLSGEAIAAIAEITRRNRSYEWKYGESPNFDIELSRRFDWGGVEICLKIKNARIEAASVYSDSLFTGFIEALEETLKGCAFSSPELYAAVSSMNVPAEEAPLAKDVAEFLRDKGF